MNDLRVFTATVPYWLRAQLLRLEKLTPVYVHEDTEANDVLREYGRVHQDLVTVGALVPRGMAVFCASVIPLGRVKGKSSH